MTPVDARPATKDPRAIVREGYDRVSLAYRPDDSVYEGSGYSGWLGRVEPHLAPGVRVLDLGCGCGVPVSRHLAQRFDVTGVDLSPVQIERARALVPGARFVCADMTAVDFDAGSFAAVVALFATIHVPVAEQRGLFVRIGRWIGPGGWLLVTLCHDAWTGTEDNWGGVEGATMYWSNADLATSRAWLTEAGLVVAEEHQHVDSDGARFMQVIARRVG